MKYFVTLFYVYLIFNPFGLLAYNLSETDQRTRDIMMRLDNLLNGRLPDYHKEQAKEANGQSPKPVQEPLAGQRQIQGLLGLLGGNKGSPYSSGPLGGTNGTDALSGLLGLLSGSSGGSGDIVSSLLSTLLGGGLLNGGTAGGLLSGLLSGLLGGNFPFFTPLILFVKVVVTIIFKIIFLWDPLGLQSILCSASGGKPTASATATAYSRGGAINGRGGMDLAGGSYRDVHEVDEEKGKKGKKTTDAEDHVKGFDAGAGDDANGLEADLISGIFEPTVAPKTETFE